MGMRMVADYSGGKPPYPVSIRLTCDRPHGLFAPPSEEFDCTNEQPRAPPTRAGWKITPDGEVLCPECATKKAG